MSSTSAKQRDYASSLRRLMESKDGTTYPKDKQFTQQELLAITPDHVVAWFNELAFGTKIPAPDARPEKCRSNTLLNHKKKVSFFHPRKDQQWDSIRGEGNPTRAQSVNALIAIVKRHEVRQTGVPSQARRAFSLAEFIKLLAIVEGITNDENKNARFRALATLQWQLIGRVDDIQKTQVSCLFFLFFSFSDILTLPCVARFTPAGKQFLVGRRRAAGTDGLTAVEQEHSGRAGLPASGCFWFG